MIAAIHWESFGAGFLSAVTIFIIVRLLLDRFMGDGYKWW